MTAVCETSTDPLKRPSSPRGDRRPVSIADQQSEHRRLTAPDANQDIRAPIEVAKLAALRAPARVKRAIGGHSDVIRALENRHRWLLFAQHCYTCSQREEECDLGKLCIYGKKTLKHVAQCKKDDCSYPRCGLLKPLLQHSRRCQSSTCAICVPVWNYIQKDMQQQQQQLNSQAGLQQPDGGGAPSATAPQAWGQHGADAAHAGSSGSGFAASSRTDLAVAGPGGSDSHAITGGAKQSYGTSDNGAGGVAAACPVPAGSLGPHANLQTQSHRAPGAAPRHPGQQQQHPTFTSAAIASAPSGGTHRVLGLASGPAGIVPQYSMPPYASGPTAAVDSQLDAVDRSNVVNTPVGQSGLQGASTPPPPMPAPVPITTTRPGGLQAPPNTAGHSPLVHSYPPSGALGAYFPHLVHHHTMPHSHAPGPASASGAAVATHWLPLQGLTAPTGTVNAAGTAGTGSGNVLGGASSLAAGGVAPPGTAVWAGQAQLRPGGPVALYCVPHGAADGVRSGNLSGQHNPVPIMEQYGHPYAIASGGGGPAPQQLLLWSAGHQTTAALSAGPAAAQGPAQGHLPAHLSAPYTVAASGGARINRAAGPASAGGGHGLNGVNGMPGMSTQQLPPHTVVGPPLFGQQGMRPSGSGGGSGSSAASVPAELATGAALWSYVLR